MSSPWYHRLCQWPESDFEAGRPELPGVHDAAGERIVEAVLAVLLEEGRLIDAGEVQIDEVRRGLADLEDVRAVVERVGRHHVVAEIDAAVCLEELRRDPVQVVTERVIGGQEVPLGVFDQALALLPQPDRLGVHRVATLHVEHEAVAVGAAQLDRSCSRC